MPCYGCHRKTGQDMATFYICIKKKLLKKFGINSINTKFKPKKKNKMYEQYFFFSLEHNSILLNYIISWCQN